MRLPAKKRPGNPVLASDWNLMIDALQARTPMPAHNAELVASTCGFTYRFRQSSSQSAVQSGQPFAEIISWNEGNTRKTGIRGGAVYAGDKVWNVDHQPLNLGASGVFQVWLEIGVTAVVEDNVLLPGIKTSTAPQWKQQSGDNFDDQQIPELPEGTGKAIVAIGTLTIEDGAARLLPASRGSILISHCPGILWHSRILDPEPAAEDPYQQ